MPIEIKELHIKIKIDEDPIQKFQNGKIAIGEYKEMKSEIIRSLYTYYFRNFKRKTTKMIEGALGIIDKMRIEVYPSQKFNENEVLKTIFVQFNPEKYSINHEVQFFEEQVQGSSKQSPTFNRIGSEEVSFDFLFDSSGIVPPAKIKDGKVEKNIFGRKFN